MATRAGLHTIQMGKSILLKPFVRLPIGVATIAALCWMWQEARPLPYVVIGVGTFLWACGVFKLETVRE